MAKRHGPNCMSWQLGECRLTAGELNILLVGGKLGQAALYRAIPVQTETKMRREANMPYVQVIPEALEMANQGHPTEYIMLERRFGALAHCADVQEFLAHRRGDPIEERTRRIDARYEEELGLGLLWQGADSLLHCRVAKGEADTTIAEHIGTHPKAQPGERRVLAAVRATDMATFTLAKDADLSNTGRRRSPPPELLQKARKFTKWAKERLILAVADVDVVQHVVRHSAYESQLCKIDVVSRHLHACQEIVINELDKKWVILLLGVRV
ncbi:unnamed protein product [Symbiodinium necroappetens]|uniref:Uncharacterized protein n=1 Tax=Symbiodinium necroappetens TaxID=1628268 RepID=A0A812NNN8_9DINO|nr:unnamed protein product [Symbiodinium necroappetens]